MVTTSRTTWSTCSTRTAPSGGCRAGSTTPDNHDPGGWFWRYDLTPNGDRTDVTLTYDWSATPQDFRDQVGGMPVFPEDYLAASLATLERSVTSAE